jgi:hypothetical protein
MKESLLGRVTNQRISLTQRKIKVHLCRREYYLPFNQEEGRERFHFMEWTILHGTA